MQSHGRPTNGTLEELNHLRPLREICRQVLMLGGRNHTATEVTVSNLMLEIRPQVGDVADRTQIGNWHGDIGKETHY